jgi:hypothetical protein
MSGGGNTRPAGGSNQQSRSRGNTRNRQNSRSGTANFIDRPLRGITRDLTRAYKQGYGGGYYPGTTYVPPTANQNKAVGMIEKLAGSPSKSLAGADKALQGIFSSGGINSTMKKGLKPLQMIASGKLSIKTEKQLKELYKQAMEQTAAKTYLTDTASGKMLAEGNPYANQVISDTLGDMSDVVSSQFSGLGRYGSDDHAEDIAGKGGQIAAQMRMGVYDAERGRQLQATGMLDAAEQARLGTGLGITNARSQVQGANISNRAAAGNSIAGIGQMGQQNLLAGAALAPGIDQARYYGTQQLMAAGSWQQQQLQAQAMDAARRWEAANNAPINHAAPYLSMLTGMAPIYGTNSMASQGMSNSMSFGSGSSYVPNNPWGNAMGGALGGYALGGPVGGLLGGGAGYFM